MATVSGGDKLAAALNKIASALKKKSSVEVGFLEKQTYPDGTPVALVAAFNEFGTSCIPPRPFFRNAIAKNSKKWPINLKTALKNTNYDVEISLGLLGAEIQREIMDSIQSNTPPPDADKTAKAKGFNKTLVDTGRMLGSVTHNVE